MNSICPICGKNLGEYKNYDHLKDAGDRVCASMGDYYERRLHFQIEHKMDDDEARPYALATAVSK